MDGLRLTTVVFLMATIILSLDSVVSRVDVPLLCKDIPDNINKTEVFQMTINGTIFTFCMITDNKQDNQTTSPVLAPSTTSAPEKPHNCTCSGLLCKFDNLLGTGLFKCNVAQNGVIQKLQQWEIDAMKAAEDVARRMAAAVAGTDSAIQNVTNELGKAVVETGIAVKDVIVNTGKALQDTVKNANEQLTEAVIGHNSTSGLKAENAVGV